MKTTGVIIILVLLVLGGVYIFSSNRPTSTSNERSTNELTAAEPTSAALEANYLEYSSQSFANNRDHKRVLFFYASWCPTCRPADAQFKSKMGEIPDGVKLFKVNYDIETELKKKYNITYQHTFVLVDSEGREISKWNGGEIAELISNTK